MIRIGIVGCGAIGARLAKYIDLNLKKKIRLIALSDLNRAKALRVRASLRYKPRIMEMDKLTENVDLVIEAASAITSFDIAKKALSRGKNVMVMSTGGLLKGYKKLLELAKRRRANIYLPSGAICGLDGLKAAGFSKIKKVTLTTTKPPAGFKDAPFVIKNKIDLNKIKSDKILFQGNALQAIAAFPANINVAATLSLSGIGPKKTRVRIIASPGAKKNIHEVSAEGEFGRLTARTENVPSPDNPKTSYLAVLSAIAMLNEILADVK
ncbi:MAG: aspartate dehydrogenase [Candidatus Omnitrophota bacterium]